MKKLILLTSLATIAMSQSADAAHLYVGGTVVSPAPVYAAPVYGYGAPAYAEPVYVYEQPAYPSYGRRRFHDYDYWRDRDRRERYEYWQHRHH